jgi:outer membrane lipoprotein-sorting protein
VSSGNAGVAKPAEAKPSGLFQELSTAMQGVKSFRGHITTTGSQVGASEMTLEVVMPDRFRMTGPQMEIIASGSTGYMKMPNGKWQKYALPPNTNMADLTALAEQIRGSSDVRSLPDEMLDGASMRVFEANLKAPKGPNSAQVQMLDSYTTKIWLAARDGRPRRIEASTPGSDMKTTIVYYDYNADITINIPIQ